MQASARSYPDWKAPAEDGDILIWPDARTIASQALENHKNMATAETLVAGLPLRELRKRAREWIGQRGDQPLIATGHQTELYHPGVWAKAVLAGQLAAKVGGQAFH